MNHQLEMNSWQDFEERRKNCDVIVIPVGSVEQHGFHLPLGTDSYVAQYLSVEAAEKTGATATPPLWFGWCPHHIALPGSVSVRAEVLIELLSDVMTSLCHHGCRKFVVVNGHRIVNIPWMQIAAQRVQAQSGATVKIFDPAYMSKDLIDDLGFGPVGHAEEIETSHLLYLLPHLVHLEKAVDAPIGEVHLYSVDPRYGHDTLCYVPSTVEHIRSGASVAGGAAGRPTLSDVEKGRRYHEHLVARLVDVIERLKQSS